ncbi:MAG TPA: 23S rRNA (adenine(2030)-N(6))-methyltransferase RlmJ [Steroidobacter sp.]|nr:23S rRNA (adenine(2030)-N(6))-methyltransferase RlmJ [Steroidobacter sp.]
MNYRHVFHAGNFADVHKHLVLLSLIERLKVKPKPLLYLDTHAGRGWYDLRSADASRSNEWRCGVARVIDAAAASEELRRYQQVVGAASAWGAHRYPGSPLLAAQQLRDADRIVVVEQQAAEAQALQQATRNRRGVSVVCGDGYSALKTYLPPRENRGLVLIDPPYESDNEFTAVAEALQFALRRWPTGVFAAWHPIKAGQESARFHASLQRSGLRKLLLLELTIHPADSPLGLNGSGIVIANPPWRFDEAMKPALTELQTLLDPEGAGRTRVEWLVQE